MRFEPTEEQRQVRDMVRGLARARFAPEARAWDDAGAIPDDAVATLAELGLFALRVPADDGGVGLDHCGAALVVEELARVDGSLAGAVVEHAIHAGARIASASPTARRTRCIEGLITGTALPVIVPHGAGDSAVAIDPTRRRASGSAHVPRAVAAATFLIPVGDGAAVAVVDADSPGARIGAPDPRLGLRGLGHHEVSFDGVGWEAADVLEGVDIRAAEAAARVGWAAVAVGLAAGALDEASRYALERKAFGAPIGRLQAIQHKLADMAVGVEGARLLVARAAWRLDQGRVEAASASMARLHASRVAMAVCDEAVQIHGGYGYTAEFPVERAWRDARCMAAAGGSDAAHGRAIAGNLLDTL